MKDLSHFFPLSFFEVLAPTKTMRHHWKLGFWCSIKKWQQRASLQCARFFFLHERTFSLHCSSSVVSFWNLQYVYAKKKCFKYQFYYIGNAGYNLSLKNHYVFSSFLEDVEILISFFTSFHSSKELYTVFCFFFQAVTLFIKTIQFVGRLLWKHIHANYFTLFKDEKNYMAGVHSIISHLLIFQLPFS